MDDDENYTVEDLEQCSYRYLQQVAKSMKLPSNVKKIHLIEMIHTNKYGTPAALKSIIDNVRYERLRVSQMKKIIKKKSLRVQAGEVTSTSRNSPSNSIPHESGHIVIRCPESRRSILRSGMMTDRVLRSTQRDPGSYRFLNLSNAVIGVIKSQNKSTNTDAMMSRQTKHIIEEKPKLIINKFKTNIINCNNNVLKINEDKRQVQIFRQKSGPITSTPQPAKRNRRISGIYPLKSGTEQKNMSYTSTKTINFRQDGRVSKINAVIQKPNYNNSFENFIEHKKQNVTIQDIINTNIDDHIFSDNMTEFMVSDSANTSKDYPNMSMVTEETTFIDQPTIVIGNSDFNQAETHNVKENVIRIKGLLKERHSLRMERSKPDKVHAENGELSRLLLLRHQESRKVNQNEKSFIINQSKLPVPYQNINPITNFNLPSINNNNMPRVNTDFIQCNCNTTQLNSSTSQNTYNSSQANSSLSNNWTSNYIENDNLKINDSNEDQWSVFYHRKKNTEQGPKVFQKENYSEGLPKINEVFSMFNNGYKDYSQPLYVQVSNETERASFLTSPIAFVTNQCNNTILENLYNIKKSFITNQPLLQIATTNNTTCVYSTPIISTPMVKQPLGEQITYTLHQPDSFQEPEPYRRGRMHEFQQITQEKGSSERKFKSDSSDSVSSPDNSLSKDLNVNIPEMVEDALELISQDGDYMERINMDVRVQCFSCDWAGPRIILESHLKKEHTIQVCLYDSWQVGFALTSLRDVWNSKILEKNKQLYVISAKWENNRVYAALTSISFDTTIKTGMITFYNRNTSEHISWRGAIQQSHSNMPYENYTNGLLVQLDNNIVPENSSTTTETIFSLIVKIFD